MDNQFYIADIKTEENFFQDKISDKAFFRQERAFDFNSFSKDNLLFGEMTNTFWLLNDKKETVCELKTIVPFSIKAFAWTGVSVGLLIFLMKQTVAYGQSVMVYYTKTNKCFKGVPPDTTDYKKIENDFNLKIREISN